MTAQPASLQTNGMTDGLSDQLSNWQTVQAFRLIQYLTDCLAYWLTTACLNNWLTDWLANQLTNLTTNWPAGLLTDWLTDWLTKWLPDLTEILSDGYAERLVNLSNTYWIYRWNNNTDMVAVFSSNIPYWSVHWVQLQTCYHTFHQTQQWQL